MSRRAFVAAGVLILLGAGALAVLKIYALEIVHSVVIHAVTVKAPPGYPTARIRAEFDRALAQARDKGGEEHYLEKLKQISQRLEKMQEIDARSLDQLLLTVTER